MGLEPPCDQGMYTKKERKKERECCIKLCRMLIINHLPKQPWICMEIIYNNAKFLIGFMWKTFGQIHCNAFSLIETVVTN